MDASRRRMWWQLGLLVAGVAWVYAPAIWWMADRWWAADSYYSHGPLIPVISALLLWWRRKELSELTLCPSRLGLWVIGLGLLLQVGCAVWRIYFASALSLLVVLIGLVLAWGGWGLWRRVWFPVVFLLFMVPMPLAFIAQLSLQLKLVAASSAAQVIWWFGIPVMQDGSTLYLPHGIVLVEDLCSGLRSLIALLALGVLVTYLTKTVWWKRGILLATTPLIAIGANIFRITAVSLASEVYGFQLASGAFHDVMGFVSFGVAYAALSALGAWLRS